MEVRLVHLLGSLNRGGTETLLLDVFNNWRNEDVIISGIYRKKGSLSAEFRESKTQLIQLKPGFFACPVYLFRLRKNLKKNQTNIVHAHQAIDALYAWLACRGTGIRVILTFHGYNFRYGLLRNLITKFIINKTDLNIYVSNSQKEKYKKKYRIKDNSKQKVVYNGISFNKLNNIEGGSVKQEFNIPENIMLLGSVGNFVKVRDQFTICKFLNLLNKAGIKFAFVFAGGMDASEPEHFNNCIQYSKDNNLTDKVFFPGSRNDIPSFLSQLDAFVYSTRFDTFGIAVIEAISKGLPVFVNDWEVITEITGNGEYVVLYETESEHDLFKKFMQFLKEKNDYNNSAKKAASWAVNKYSIEEHIGNLIRSYKELIVRS